MPVCLTAMILGGLLITGPVFAQDPIIYPKQGQGKEQVEKDKYTCYTWAKEETKFDSMAPNTDAPPPQQQASQASAVKGAAAGALIGLAAGSLGGEAGKGAAVGAVAGGLMGGMRSANQKKQQQQAAQQQAAAHNQKRETYNRAYGACLEAKGYTVK